LAPHSGVRRNAYLTLFDSVVEALGSCGISVPDTSVPQPIGGGDISAAWKIQTTDRPIFLKTGETDSLDMFAAEADGLRELAKANAIRVPVVLAVLNHAGGALLALEWLNLGAPQAGTEKTFGQQLANLHKCGQNRYGWFRNNTIGLTPQPNEQSDNWVEFFRDQRLAYQLHLASQNGFGGDLQSEGQKLLENMGALFYGYSPAASLLHGDLWGGNWSSVEGQPVIYDPAVYYGDRETDLAMTKLFGGFGAEFYRAYEESWPLDEGSEKRVALYQLYHVLNHLNLFGGTYLGRTMALLKDLNS